MFMNEGLGSAVEKTVRYAEFFDFPLTETELRQYLIGEKAPSSLPLGSLARVGEFVMRPGREKLAAVRVKRSLYSQKKIARAIKVAHFLRIFPGVRMVGLTGSVAAHNAVKLDDIDLLIVTAAGRLWMTRAIIFVTLRILGLKRPDNFLSHYNAENRDKLCFNMWLEDSPGGLATRYQDLYTAYEVCLMKPLLGGETYYRFLKANRWTVQFLPNFSASFGGQYLQDSRLIQDLGHVAQYLAEGLVLWGLGWAFEPLARWFSRRRISWKETKRRSLGVFVSDQKLMFHPASPRERILAALENSA